MEKDVKAMRNCVVKKVMVNGFSGWTDNPNRAFLVFEVDHNAHRIKMDYEGSNIDFGILYNLCMSDKDLREEIKWGIQVKRKYPAKVTVRNGMSGCIDYELRSFECDPEFIPYFKGYTMARLHISCFGKIEPRFEMWSGDLAAFLYADQPFAFSSNAAFICLDDKQTCIRRSCYIKYINPNRIPPYGNRCDHYG